MPPIIIQYTDQRTSLLSYLCNLSSSWFQKQSNCSGITARRSLICIWEIRSFWRIDQQVKHAGGYPKCTLQLPWYDLITSIADEIYMSEHIMKYGVGKNKINKNKKIII